MKLSRDTIKISWSLKAPAPYEFGWQASTIYDDRIYIFGGFRTKDEVVELSSSVMIYDPSSDSWDLTTKNFKTGRWGHTASVVNNKIYLMGGCGAAQGPALETIEVFDPATKAWSEAGEMPFGRIGHAAVVLNEKIYIIGGEVKEPSLSSGILRSCSVFDPYENTWESLASLPAQREFMGACTFGGKIYVLAGTQIYPFTGLSTIFEYDPEIDEWNEKGPLPGGVIYPSVCRMDNKIFTMGGVILNYTPGIDKVRVYNPEVDSVYIAEPINVARYAAASGFINNRIYLLGGVTTGDYRNFTDAVEEGVLVNP